LRLHGRYKLAIADRGSGNQNGAAFYRVLANNGSDIAVLVISTIAAAITALRTRLNNSQNILNEPKIVCL
jgi:hypothetical protein